MTGEYTLAEMYLSLARQSDEAFKNLIGYFEKVDEPTMIVMFGASLAETGRWIFIQSTGKKIRQL